MKKLAKTIYKKRKNMGLSQREFALLFGLKINGERTVRGWENGDHVPSKAKLNEILSLPNKAPFKHSDAFEGEFKFIDLFAGIGGIRLAFQLNSGNCVFSSEWDKFAQKTYASNFGELPKGDIRDISGADIPDHDILAAGFPCQAFSQAGLKKGFSDARGTMFFEIQKILQAKRPKAFLLENVKQLKGHDKGRTLSIIYDILQGTDIPLGGEINIPDAAKISFKNKLNYYVDHRVLRAGDFGLPQNRERIFIVGFNRDYFPDADFDKLFEWPTPLMIKTKLGDILEESKNLDEKYTISEKLWNGHKRRKIEHRKKGNGFGYSLFTKDSEYANTLSARYYKDGSEILIDQSDIGKRPRKLTPRECARLQGLPEKFIVDAVSSNQAYKQFGNSVAVPVVEAVAKKIITTLKVLELNNN